MGNQKKRSVQKMFSMKKTLCLVLTVAMAGMLLAGCGGGAKKDAYPAQNLNGIIA